MGLVQKLPIAPPEDDKVFCAQVWDAVVIFIYSAGWQTGRQVGSPVRRLALTMRLSCSLQRLPLAMRVSCRLQPYSLRSQAL